jgi:hypothetical protein
MKMLASAPLVRPTKPLLQVFTAMATDTVPTSVDSWLRQHGTDATTPELLQLLETLGFLSDRRPSARWQQYAQNSITGRAALLQASISDVYRDLLATLPNATGASVPTLTAWFANHSKYPRYRAAAAARTFRLLQYLMTRELGTHPVLPIQAPSPAPVVRQSSNPHAPTSRSSTPGPAPSAATTIARPGPVLFMLPLTHDPNVYRAVFGAYRDVFGSAPPL